ncbi:MAG: hypothetical protein ABR964_03325 [Tepidisphaeraceae bacterium]|jgi:hypothetical protein
MSMPQEPRGRSGLIPLPQPGKLSSRIVASLKREAAIVADVVGSLGFVALVLEFFHWANKSSLLGISAIVWAWTVGLLPFLVIGAWATFDFIRILKDGIRVRDDAIKLREEKIRVLEAAVIDASAQKPRSSQRLIWEAVRGVYGFHIVLRRHAYTVYRDGHATCRDTVVFKCNRRSLGTWSRTISSSAVEEFAPAADLQIEPHKFKATRTEERRMPWGEGGRTLLETFSIVPTIQAEDGEVKFSYLDVLPPKSFVFQKDAAAPKRTIDFVMTTPWEPIETLEVEVEFHDIVPGRVSADAVYNPAGEPLLQEAQQAEEILREFDRDGRRVAALKVPFPMMGVGYRVKWDLE